ncbi:peroxiredoxin [bacterium]|nr:peroxiredoxin [bacterium]
MRATIGKDAPDFNLQATVKGGDFSNVKLSDYKGKWVVLFFYPLDFTFVCPTEIKEFNKHYEEFQKIGAEIIGASVDSVFSHKAWYENGLGDIKFPILSDIKKTLSQDYGVLNEDMGVAFRGTFLIDPDGVLRSVTINDLNVGRSVKETYRLVQAFQIARETEGNIPCEWNPGDDTL